MDEVQVSNWGDDQGFESTSGETLYDACGEEVVVANLCLSNCSTNDTEERWNKEDGPFAIFATERADYGSGAACGKKIVARDKHDGSQWLSDFLSNDEVWGIEEWSLCWSECVGLMGGTALTFVPAFSIAPRHKMATIISFFHIGQLRGSFGSSLGCGESTMWEFVPVPCLRLWVISSVWAAWSFNNTVPGTWVSLWSRTQ